ncbi:MAG: helix-turn-helix transcriptional regulator [Clostridia bacterium]|nr:helix-turn-helix transcriptional regulator [Clostridia bacterium]
MAQLSESSGLPISTISDIEHGAEPRVITAIILARALDTCVEQLWPI